MATEGPAQPIKDDNKKAAEDPIPDKTKKPLYLLPRFTSDRWSDGIYDAEHQKSYSSLTIREDDLLSYEQKLEAETRTFIFHYQMKYAEKEYELLKKEFQKIEESLKLQEASDAEQTDHVFVKPTVPAKKTSKAAGKPKKKATGSRSGSETDDKAASADESAVSGRSTRRRGRQTDRSGSETDEKGVSGDEPAVSDDQKAGRRTRKTTKSKSGSETDKELTSSQEGTEEPRRSSRTTRSGNK